MNHLMRGLVLGGAVLALSGCSTVTDMIAPAKVDPPAELQDIEGPILTETAWTTDVGSGSDEQRLNLVPFHDQGRLYVADASGDVVVLDAANGQRHWSVSLDAPVSGGPGAGDGLVAVGTLDAEVIALQMADGQERWRSTVSSEVLATPVIAQGRVIVRTIDGKIFGLDAATGEQKWIYEREIPVLTLRGTATPAISGSNVLCGLAGGKLLALDIKTGEVQWESTVSVPSGRSELERLSDIDGTPLMMDGLVFVATYQGDVAALSEQSGRLLWRRKFSAYSDMAVDQNQLYASDASGFVWAMDVDNGAARWKQEALKNRQLSSVAVLDKVLAVGDFEGYVHFLSIRDGALIGRTRVGSDPITRGVLKAGDVLYVQGEGGDLEALRLPKGN